MNAHKTLLILAALLAGTAYAQSAPHAHPATPMASDTHMQTAPSVGDMTTGEVRKVDKDTQKVTIKHGDIKNLDMPGMTMVFRVKDAAQLDQLKPGSKILFKAESVGGSLFASDIQPAQ